MADKIPCIGMEELVELVFPDDRQKRKSAMTQVNRNRNPYLSCTMPLTRALDALERYVGMSTAKCLTSDKDWRQRFEASEAFAELPGRLLEAQRLQRQKDAAEAARQRGIADVKQLQATASQLARDLKQRARLLSGRAAGQLQAASADVALIERMIGEVYDEIKDPDPPKVSTE